MQSYLCLFVSQKQSQLPDNSSFTQDRGHRIVHICLFQRDLKASHNVFGHDLGFHRCWNRLLSLLFSLGEIVRAMRNATMKFSSLPPIKTLLPLYQNLLQLISHDFITTRTHSNTVLDENFGWVSVLKAYLELTICNLIGFHYESPQNVDCDRPTKAIAAVRMISPSGKLS